MRGAVFLDKDGTLVEDVPYNVDPDRIVLTKGAREACRSFHAAGYALVVVTNQSGVARGLFKENALQKVADRLRELLAMPPLIFLHCPHGPEDDCSCRKPKPGLLHRAVAAFDIDISRSWMVGDILNDVEAGARAGCGTILLDRGGETEWLRGPFRTPDYVVNNMREAAVTILGQRRIMA